MIIYGATDFEGKKVNLEFNFSSGSPPSIFELYFYAATAFNNYFAFHHSPYTFCLRCGAVFDEKSLKWRILKPSSTLSSGVQVYFFQMELSESTGAIEPSISSYPFLKGYRQPTRKRVESFPRDTVTAQTSSLLLPSFMPSYSAISGKHFAALHPLTYEKSEPPIPAAPLWSVVDDPRLESRNSVHLLRESDSNHSGSKNSSETLNEELPFRKLDSSSVRNDSPLRDAPLLSLQRYSGERLSSQFPSNSCGNSVDSKKGEIVRGESVLRDQRAKFERYMALPLDEFRRQLREEPKENAYECIS